MLNNFVFLIFLCFFCILKNLISFDSSFHSFCISSFYFLDLFLLELIFLDLHFLEFFFWTSIFLVQKPNSSNYPFHMHFVHPSVHLLPLFSLLVFSFLPHVFSFSFFCFLCVWPLSKTPIWKLLHFWSFHFLLSFYLNKEKHDFACLPFSLFFFEKKKEVSFFNLTCFWTLTFFVLFLQ